MRVCVRVRLTVGRGYTQRWLRTAPMGNMVALNSRTSSAVSGDAQKNLGKGARRAASQHLTPNTPQLHPGTQPSSSPGDTVAPAPDPTRTGAADATGVRGELKLWDLPQAGAQQQRHDRNDTRTSTENTVQTRPPHPCLAGRTRTVQALSSSARLQPYVTSQDLYRRP